MSSKPYKFSVDEILKQSDEVEDSRLSAGDSDQIKHPEDLQINAYNLNLIRTYQKLIESQKSSSSIIKIFIFRYLSYKRRRMISVIHLSIILFLNIYW